jgi:hypothetical protein
LPLLLARNHGEAYNISLDNKAF